MKNVPLEFRILAKKMRATKIFLRKRTIAKNLYQNDKEGMTVTQIDKVNGRKTIMMFGSLWETEKSKCFELGTFWKDESNTRRGCSLTILKGLMLLVPKGSMVFISTRSRIIKRVVKKAGWKYCRNPHHSILKDAVDPNRNFGDGRTVYYLQTTH